MATLPSFDDFDDEDSSQQSDYKPFQFRDETSEEGTLEWLNDNFNYAYMNSRERLMSYRRISNRYKNAGDPNLSGFTRDARRDMGEANQDKPKVRTNFFYEYTEQKVASVSKRKINPVFIPENDSEQDDINDAEACNLLVKHRMREIGIEAKMRDQDRKTFKYGMSFNKVFWNKCAGPIDPKYKTAAEKYGKIPLIGEDDKVVKNKFINKYEAKLGDADIKVLDSDCFFPERKKKKLEDLDFGEDVCFENIDQLRAEYPNSDVRKEEYYWLDVDNRGYNQSDMVMVHYFYHRPTKYLPEGAFIKYIESAILEWDKGEEMLKRHMADEQLPYVEDTDIEVDDEFWARPFLINIEQPNNFHDLITSGMARNFGVSGHPKLMIHEGSVNLKQADNKYGVMQWRGVNKPEWLQHNWVNRGEFEVQDRLEKTMDRMSRRFDISKGVVPTGITATSALRLLDDQEIEANSTTTTKRAERVKKTYWKLMMFQAANYRDEDERMVHILGANNEYLIKSFKKLPLFSKLHSVEIENISALADNRSGRVNDIIDLNAANQKEPTFGRKEIVKLLDLGLEEAFKDEINYAAVTSRTILEQLKAGEKAMPPEMSDDLIEMWMIFSRFVESITYKMKLKAKTKAMIKDYIQGLEYLMEIQATRNMLFRSKVQSLSKYPMFYVPGALITTQPPMPPAGAGPGKPADPNKPLQELGKKAEETNGEEV